MIYWGQGKSFVRKINYKLKTKEEILNKQYRNDTSGWVPNENEPKNYKSETLSQ